MHKAMMLSAVHYAAVLYYLIILPNHSYLHTAPVSDLSREAPWRPEPAMPVQDRMRP